MSLVSEFSGAEVPAVMREFAEQVDSWKAALDAGQMTKEEFVALLSDVEVLRSKATNNDEEFVVSRLVTAVTKLATMV